MIIRQALLVEIQLLITIHFPLGNLKPHQSGSVLTAGRLAVHGGEIGVPIIQATYRGYISLV
jgi:hypothetical protein